MQEGSNFSVACLKKQGFGRRDVGVVVVPSGKSLLLHAASAEVLNCSAQRFL